MKYNTDSFAYKEIDVFQSEDPESEEDLMRTYCYDILTTDEDKITVSDEVKVKVSIKDPSTGNAVSGVQVTSSPTTDDSEYIVTT